MKIAELEVKLEETINATSETGLAIAAIASHARHYFREAEGALARLESVYQSIGNDRDAEFIRHRLESLRSLAEVERGAE